jgi:Glyoxalase-like domain
MTTTGLGTPHVPPPLGPPFYERNANTSQTSSSKIYRRLRLPNTDIRVLLQLVPDDKHSKSRLHIDLETDDVEAERSRVEALGAASRTLVEERGYRFWVMLDPFGNEFCIIQAEFPDLLSDASAWHDEDDRTVVGTG